MSSTYAEPLAVLARGLDDLATIDPGYRTTGEQKDLLVGLSRVHHPRRRPSGCGCLRSPTTSPRRPAPGRPRTGWRTRPGSTSARYGALSVLAEALDERWTEVGTAVAAGAVERRRRLTSSSRPSTRSRTSLDDETRCEGRGPPDRARPAASGRASCARLGRGLLEVLAPEIADEVEYQTPGRRGEAVPRRDQAEHPRPRRRDQRHHRPDPRPRTHTGSSTYLDAYTIPASSPVG